MFLYYSTYSTIILHSPRNKRGSNNTSRAPFVTKHDVNNAFKTKPNFTSLFYALSNNWVQYFNNWVFSGNIRIKVPWAKTTRLHMSIYMHVVFVVVVWTYLREYVISKLGFEVQTTILQRVLWYKNRYKLVQGLRLSCVRK